MKEEKVVIVKGLFKGHTGRFLRSHGDSRVAVRIDEIGYSVIIRVAQSELALYPDGVRNELVSADLAV